MIKNFKPRLYQESILSTAALKNTLVVLPTGLGKTNVFLMLTALRLKQYPNSKILLVGPTKPLIDQYFSTFEKHFDIKKQNMAIFTGETSPKKRIELWKTSKIIFSTPQSIENDIISKRINLTEVSLLGIDEAHRAVNKYAYVWVAKEYNNIAKYPRIIGLTASPGSDKEKITQICQNLFIEKVEVRTEHDSDVKPYIQETEIKYIEVELTKELKLIKKYLDNALSQRIKKLKDWKIIHQTKYLNKTTLISLQSQLHKEAVIQKTNYNLWQGISIVAEIMKLQHAVLLLESQGISPLHDYLTDLRAKSITTKTKAVKNLVIDSDFKSAFILTDKLKQQNFIHPKLEKLKKIISQNKNNKIMVFTQFRDTGSKITQELNTLPDINAKLFVGQLKKKNTGMSQKEQKVMLDEFRQNKFNILVATSIAEEGLDIPKVDLVIFYEPVPSAIRHIQRKGRTGRLEKGRIFILLSKDTRDVGIRWASHHKQKRMYKILNEMKNKINSPLVQNKNQNLNQFLKKSNLMIYVDYREKSTPLLKKLSEKGLNIKLEKLESADYLCSSQTGIEYKKIPDFVNSIIDGRLLEQIKNLKQNYQTPLLILEGEEDIYSIRKIHKNAINGMLATITINYQIPILQTKNEDETADLLYIITKREQENNNTPFSPHSEKQNQTPQQQQEYIISSLPGIGPTLAKPLLKEFKTIKNIINANQTELTKIPKLGKIKANKIKEIVEKEYNE